MGIVVWIVIYLIMTAGMIFSVPVDMTPLKSIVAVGLNLLVLSLLGYSVLTKWKKGDR